MHVRRVDVYAVSYTHVGGPFAMSGGRVSTGQDGALVRVETDDGLVGWGESTVIAPDYAPGYAPATIAERLSDGVDIVVHNAGVTRDRTIAKMPEDRWSSLMEINLSGEERINDELLHRDLLRNNGRIVCVSSMSGIAGNSGQTNYATSKAGVIGTSIGMLSGMAPSRIKASVSRKGVTERSARSIRLSVPATYEFLLLSAGRAVRGRSRQARVRAGPTNGNR